MNITYSAFHFLSLKINLRSKYKDEIEDETLERQKKSYFVRAKERISSKDTQSMIHLLKIEEAKHTFPSESTFREQQKKINVDYNETGAGTRVEYTTFYGR